MLPRGAATILSCLVSVTASEDELMQGQWVTAKLDGVTCVQSRHFNDPQHTTYNAFGKDYIVIIKVNGILKLTKQMICWWLVSFQ